MYVQFDERSMHVQVVVGTLEEYSPTAEIKEINERVVALREKMMKFQDEVMAPELVAIRALVEKTRPKTESAS